MSREALGRVLARLRGQCEQVEGFKYGLDKVEFAHDHTPGQVKMWIPSGIALLDYALGGGLPCGRVIELFSEQESEGKTTLGLHFMAQLQRRGGAGLWLEQETAMDKDRAQRGLGVDTDSLLITCPHSVEDGFIIIRSWIEQMAEEPDYKGKPLLIVWDTIAAAPTRASQAGDMFAGGMAEKPRVIAEALRSMVQFLYKNNATLLMLNQSYTNISARLPFPVYEQPGGKGLKFYSSVRVKVKKIGYTAEGKTVKGGKEGQNTKTGIIAEVSTVKNKVAPPYRSVNLALLGPTGYNNPLSFAHYYSDTKQTDMISQSGSGRYGLPSGDTVYWKDIETLDKDPSWPTILGAWCQRATELFPLPPDRQLNPETGWIEAIEGVEPFQSFGDGEKEMSAEDVEIMARKVVKSRKKKGIE